VSSQRWIATGQCLRFRRVRAHTMPIQGVRARRWLAGANPTRESKPLRALVTRRLYMKTKETPRRFQAVTKPNDAAEIRSASKFRNGLASPGVEGLARPGKASFKNSFDQKSLLSPATCLPETEAHAKSGRRSTNLMCAGEGSAPLHYQDTRPSLTFRCG
jgi:hypothetical protein